MAAKRGRKKTTRQKIEVAIRELEDAVKDIRTGLEELRGLVKIGECDGFEFPKRRPNQRGRS